MAHSSWAKKAEAALMISFARLSWAFSFRPASENAVVVGKISACEF
ncbi:hypothetical protein [Streptomyces sp. NPDC093707]